MTRPCIGAGRLGIYRAHPKAFSGLRKISLSVPSHSSKSPPLFGSLLISILIPSSVKNNLKAIFAGLIGGVIGGLASIYILALIFGLNHEFFVTLLPKSVTAPIGMGVSEKLGGVVTITVASIIITGIFGNMCGAFFLKHFRVKNSVAKGLALGAASHAMGVARAIEMGSIEGAMASLALAVTGLLTVVGASIFAMFL